MNILWHSLPCTSQHEFIALFSGKSPWKCFKHRDTYWLTTNKVCSPYNRIMLPVPKDIIDYLVSVEFVVQTNFVLLPKNYKEIASAEAKRLEQIREIKQTPYAWRTAQQKNELEQLERSKRE